jgi:hypothetical protein
MWLWLFLPPFLIDDRWRSKGFPFYIYQDRRRKKGQDKYSIRNCLQNFDKFLEDIIRLRQGMRTPISIDFNFLTYPEFQSFKILDQMSIDQYYNKYEKVFARLLPQFNEHETNRYSRLLTLLDVREAPNQTALAKDFLSFIKQFAQRRNKDISKIDIYGHLNDDL